MNEFTWPVRVYYENTDAGGVVYHADYLNFMERARTEWLRSMGFEQEKLSKELAIIFAVRKVTIDYIKPANFDELLTVNTRILRQGKASLLFEQSITNEEKEKVCQAEIKIACLDNKNMKPAPIPDNILLEIDHVN
jgi:acyl-CoA thioester hydrolase